MVVLDSTVLLLFFFPEAKAPLDPATGQALTRCRERLDLLLQTLSGSGVTVVVPTPVLAELLILAGTQKARILTELGTSAVFSAQPFDMRAAVELSELVDADLKTSRKLDPSESRAKVKFDSQILAIAKVADARSIYTDDESLGRKARANGLTVIRTCDLPLPPEPPQRSLPFDESGNDAR